MNQARATQAGNRPSILHNREKDNGQIIKKRASFSDAVVNTRRRQSDVSFAHSEGTSDSARSKEIDILRRSNVHKLPKMSRRSDSDYSFVTESSSMSVATTLNKAFGCFSEERASKIRDVLAHPAYKIFIYILTVILLFGGSLQDLLLHPMAADKYVDVVFTVTLVFLLLDILVQCFVIPTYFIYHPVLQFRKNTTDEYGFLCFAFQLGSFIFWFDLLSVLSFLWEISYFNPRLTTTREYVLTVTASGDIIKGLPGEPLHCFNYNPDLIFGIILRIGRAARLLRSLQPLLSIMNDSFCFRNRTSRDMEYGKTKIHSQKELMEMEEAAIKIQRMWRAIQMATWQNEVGVKGEVMNLFLFKIGSGVRERKNKTLEKITYQPYEEVNHDEKTNGTGINDALRNHNVYRDERNHRLSTDEKKKTRKKRSQIGSAMNEKTMRHVSIVILLGIFGSFFCTYLEHDRTKTFTAVSIHNTMVLLKAENETARKYTVEAAKASSTPTLCYYEFIGQNRTFSYKWNTCNHDGKRDREILNVTICSTKTNFTNGTCDDNSPESKTQFVPTKSDYSTGVYSIIFTVFLLSIWCVGLIGFIGPVTTLVVNPIERMTRLLEMLGKDPLGYSKSLDYKIFMTEDMELAKNTMWTRESLKGMETSFLMSTILRIGSLMKVGFGSAGVEMIKSSLDKNQQKTSRNSIFGNQRHKGTGSTVPLIFMFCDIRGFTDSSECLNEEVFVFTNRIAEVVHSYCHAYGGSANKNIGDAFLLSWRLDEDEDGDFKAERRQADRALLAVVKICIALYHESFFLEGLSESSITALKKKFAKRRGNLVQIGFGLHAGRAVEGAIGSQRKLDATYLSEAVELSEYLESSTKKYGVNILVSGEFHCLLHKNVKVMCRKIDHVFFTEEYEDDDPTEHDLCDDNENNMALHTFDMDIDPLFNTKPNTSEPSSNPDTKPLTASHRTNSKKAHRPRSNSYRGNDDKARLGGPKLSGSMLRRMSIFGGNHGGPKEHSFRPNKNEDELQPPYQRRKSEREAVPKQEAQRKLDIPEGNMVYTASIWHFEEIRTIRKRFTPQFFQKFNTGYQQYISGKWADAKESFEFMEKHYDDGPSKFFLEKMEESDYKTPINFKWRYLDENSRLGLLD